MSTKTPAIVNNTWRPDDLPESVEDRFNAVCLGYGCDHYATLLEIATASGHIRTVRHFKQLTKAFHHSPLKKQFETVLRQLDRDALRRLDCEGVNPRDFVRSALVLLFGTPPAEIEDVVSACVELGEERALSFARDLLRKLRHTAAGRAYLAVIGIEAASAREAARRDGTSHIAVVRMKQRIRDRLSTIDVTV